MENPLKIRILERISQTRRDLIAILILSIVVLSLSVTFNLPVIILGFVEEHNSMQLDDLITLCIVLVFALAAFSYRRWKELEVEIRERKGVEHALISANTRLQLLNDITRHDIINSLTGLFLLIRRSESKVRDPDLLVEIQKEKEIADLIHRQIAFTRDYQEIGLRKPEWQDVGDVITKAWIGHRIGSVRIDSRVHGLEIFADLLLEKVFSNLIDNAMKYGGPAMTTIRFGMHRGDEEEPLPAGLREAHGVWPLPDPGGPLHLRSHHHREQQTGQRRTVRDPRAERAVPMYKRRNIKGTKGSR
jgi:signal transduction histidine kinase